MPTEPLAELLDACNRRWQRLARAADDFMPPPHDDSDVPLTPDLRARYNRWLPVDRWLRDMRMLLALRLPEPSWLPHGLREPFAWSSLPDLWRDLPPGLSGRVSWRRGELWPLACALADPQHFGTRAGRYPEQTALLQELDLPAQPLIIEHACGTGQSTWALAAELANTGRRPLLIGITREPLEAWMATHRRLPHHRVIPLDRAFPAPPAAGRVCFAAGDAGTLALRRPADLIVCNGLLGGPALHRKEALERVINRLVSSLADGGALLIGDHFHAGWAATRDHALELLRHHLPRHQSHGNSHLFRH